MRKGDILSYAAAQLKAGTQLQVKKVLRKKGQVQIAYIDSSGKEVGRLMSDLALLERITINQTQAKRELMKERKRKINKWLKSE